MKQIRRYKRYGIVKDRIIEISNDVATGKKGYLENISASKGELCEVIKHFMAEADRNEHKYLDLRQRLISMALTKYPKGEEAGEAVHVGNGRKRKVPGYRSSIARF